MYSSYNFRNSLESRVKVMLLFFSFSSFLGLYLLTFSRYTRFGTKLALFFWLAKTSKYKTNFKLSQLSKSLVACVRVCSDTFEKHQSSSVPIFQRNVGNFSTFQFWSLSISVAFLFSVCRQNYVLPLKLKKNEKIFRFLFSAKWFTFACLSHFAVRFRACFASAR